MASEIEPILNEMKGKGIGGAVIQSDGVPLYSTLAMNEISAGLIASAANVTDALMKKMDDTPRAMEVPFGNAILVLVPVGNYVFCGMVKEKAEKKIVVEYAEKARSVLA